ncbi:unnamed protein product [Dibothriocephalus latus]|uniref:Uncharacterized protein n=1 Tax=Dibothriocephalus latus TaxID=60516 RepID=A0A3P7QXI3_DIBLA|nr:unnamed protein product [Dibothriocephalus latus]
MPSPADVVAKTVATDCSLSGKEPEGQTTPPTLTSPCSGPGPLKLEEVSMEGQNSTSAPTPSSVGGLQQSQQRRRKTFRLALMKRHRNRKTTPPPPLLSPNTPPRDGAQTDSLFAEDCAALSSPQRSSGIPKLTLAKCENGQFSVVPSTRDEPDDSLEAALALPSTRKEEKHSTSPIPPPSSPPPPQSASSLPPASPPIPSPTSQNNGTVNVVPAETSSRDSRIDSLAGPATAERGPVLMDGPSG